VCVCDISSLRVKNWNQLPAEELGTLLCKPKTFRKRGLGKQLKTG